MTGAHPTHHSEVLSIIPKQVFWESVCFALMFHWDGLPVVKVKMNNFMSLYVGMLSSSLGRSHPHTGKYMCTHQGPKRIPSFRALSYLDKGPGIPVGGLLDCHEYDTSRLQLVSMYTRMTVVSIGMRKPLLLI